MRVRTARTSDAGSMGALHVRAWQHTYRGLMPDDYLDALNSHDRATMWREILGGGRDPRAAVLVAEVEGHVGGFIAVGSETGARDAIHGEVHSLNVDPELWQHGVGRALLTAGCARLREVGFATAVLWVHPGNTRACRSYTALGWRLDGAQRYQHVLGVGVEEVRLRRNLMVARR